ncbi:hypothetical protein XENTR_v10006693 [Xenopus tropicalis]|nr:hypothetical protein XENTR_v10006693 [Xenopus tropicalis]
MLVVFSIAWSVIKCQLFLSFFCFTITYPAMMMWKSKIEGHRIFIAHYYNGLATFSTPKARKKETKFHIMNKAEGIFLCYLWHVFMQL